MKIKNRYDQSVIFNSTKYEVEIHNRESISIQELYNRAKEWECLPPSMTHPHVFDGQGKQQLPDKTVTPITASLNANWKIHAFSDKKSTLVIYGGNLRRHDNTEPIIPNSKVKLIIEQSTTLSVRKQFVAHSTSVIFSVFLILVSFVSLFLPLEGAWKLIVGIIGLQGGYFLPINRKRFSE